MELVDLEDWPRKAHFQFFSGLAFPFYNVTSTLDVTGFYPWVKERRLSFYHSLIYATMAVMNGLPDYLYKIRGEQVVKHEKLDPSFVVLDQEAHLLKIVNASFGGTLEEFCAQCAQREAAQTAFFPSPEDEGRDDLVYFSCLPWFSFTSLTNEMDLNPDDSIPRITWGKYEMRAGRLTLPYAVQLNHRLLDGWHLSQLVGGVQNFLDCLEL